MLEMLLMQYKEMFGEDFPLVKVAGKQEIEVINIIYDCVRNNTPYDPEKPVPNIITNAPGLK